MLVGEARDELARIASGGHDVAEVHHYAHSASGQPVGECLRAFGVPTQPVVVQGLGPQLHAVVRSLVSRGDEFGGDQVEVVVERTQRAVIERPAGQHQRPGADGGGQGEQRLEMAVPFGAADRV